MSDRGEWGGGGGREHVRWGGGKVTGNEDAWVIKVLLIEMGKNGGGRKEEKSKSKSFLLCLPSTLQ